MGAVMKKHTYRITVEHLTDADGAPSEDRPLQFEVGNHDDILAIVGRLRTRGDLGEGDATALGVGLKLFSEVMIENREHPLFSSLQPHFSQFMKELKKVPTSRPA